MAQTILIKRGLDTNLGTFTPQSGEIIWTTDTHRLIVGDGSTVGGVELNYISNTQRGIANGVATLDGNINVPASQLPPEAVVQVASVGSEAAQLGLTVTQGDLCKRSDESITYVAINSSNSSMSDWLALNVPAKVNSVNTKQGDVVLDTDDIAEGASNLYYTETRADSRVQAAINDSTSSSTTLYSSSKIDTLISSTLVYKGAWDATANTPTLSDATGTQNDYYIVSVAGSQDLGGGVITFAEGDDVIHNGTVWEKFGSTNAVESVNLKTGQVVINGGDIVITGYVPATAISSLTDTDTVNQALGKLEYKANQVVNNVKADWAETVTSEESYIENKPTLVEDFTGLGDTPNAINTADDGKVVKVNGTSSELEFGFMNLGDGNNVSVTVDDYTTLDVNGTKNVLAWTPNGTTPSNGEWAPHNIDTIITVPFTQLSDTPSDYSAGAGSVSVINAGANGLTFVSPLTLGRVTLAALDDTVITTPTLGEALIWDGTDWANQAIPAGVTALGGLSDVNLTALADGDCFKYDLANSEWINEQPLDIEFTIGELTNVTASADTATTGQILKFDGTNWAPAADDSTTTFLGLADTENTFPTVDPENYSLKVNAAGDAVEFVDTSVVDGGTF